MISRERFDRKQGVVLEHGERCNFNEHDLRHEFDSAMEWRH
jgi:hypothetical protein